MAPYLASGLLVDATVTSFREWRGDARYCQIVTAGKFIGKAVWFYANPTSRFASIRGLVAIYESKVDAYYVDDKRV